MGCRAGAGGHGRSCACLGSTWAAFASSDHQDEVRQFMDFFLAPDKQFQRATDWAWFPPGVAATEIEGFMAKEVLKLTAEQKQFVIDSTANGRAPFVHREEARLQNIYFQELSLVTSGLKTIEMRWPPSRKAGKKYSKSNATNECMGSGF